MKIQNTLQTSPVEADKLVAKINTVFAEGYEQIVVTQLDEGNYGINASKVVEE